MKIETIKISELQLDPNNARKHDDSNLTAIKNSLATFGQRKPIVVGKGNVVVAGNGTITAAKKLGWKEIDIVRVPEEWTLDQAKAFALADNRTAELADWDESILASQLVELETEGWDIAMLGFEKQIDDDADQTEPGEKVTLADRFVVPPFSILDQRAGYWQERKRKWLAMGIRSEEGRADNLLGMSDTILQINAGNNPDKKKPLTLGSLSGIVPNYYDQKSEAEKKIGRSLSLAEFESDYLTIPDTANLSTTGTSIFDPVLCELAYRWFSPESGTVFDPFAGGSVRGIVAATLGRHYTGIDLRAEQIEANQAQWLEITNDQPADQTPDTDDASALTPVQKVGQYWVKRDDTFNIMGSRGGKVRACQTIVENALAKGEIIGLITAGSRQSPQVNIVATLAKKYNLQARCHVPQGADTPELIAAAEAGAEIIRHKAGYNNVIVARAREDAQANPNWLEIPFGMEHQAIIAATASQTANLPDGISRIVVPVGSGMALAGILTGLQKAGIEIPVLGVQVGADPTDRLDKYAPKNWRNMVTIIQSDLDYHTPAERTQFFGITLDPIYEAKTLPYLQTGDLLWIVGRRETATATSTNIDITGTATWFAGDSNEMDDLLPTDFMADMIMSCPPYADLEVYSDDPADISNMPYDKFMEIYRSIISQAAKRLRDDRFAVWVIGDVRDKKTGTYRGFVPDTIRAFEDAGLRFYNDAILVSPIGSLGVRAARMFNAGRKLGKAHQNVLVFVKGDAKKATLNCGEIEIDPSFLADADQPE
jgi:1-aminocyclopropane-1-carboxylate deaminase/D-cysteine desulfhydrase-like pyridoxal-dependent ACC family enzyme